MRCICAPVRCASTRIKQRRVAMKRITHISSVRLYSTMDDIPQPEVNVEEFFNDQKRSKFDKMKTPEWEKFLESREVGEESSDKLIEKRARYFHTTERPFRDLMKIRVQGGAGGKGGVSFGRAKHKRVGKPDGGDGGRGGSVILKAAEGCRGLGHLVRIYKAKNGEDGAKGGRAGKNAKDVVVEVPCGTIVKLSPENEKGVRKKQRAMREKQGNFDMPMLDTNNDDQIDIVNSLEDEKSFKALLSERRKYGAHNKPVNDLVVEKNTPKKKKIIQRNEHEDEDEKWLKLQQGKDTKEEVIEALATDIKERKKKKQAKKARNKKEEPEVSFETPGVFQVDLDKDGQTFTLCSGGNGGRGNSKFASGKNRSPKETDMTEGTTGEEKWFTLELKSIADIGLVGFPNAGKSTLLSRFSKAGPKIANYPFTTLHPQMGVLQYSDYSRITMADLPGIIHDAHKGRGLGLQFLRHIERCDMIAFVLDISGEYSDPWEDFDILKKELEYYKKGLAMRASLIIANKMDKASSFDELKIFKDKLNEDLNLKHIPVMGVSGLYNTNIEDAKNLVRDLMDELKKKDKEAKQGEWQTGKNW